MATPIPGLVYQTGAAGVPVNALDTNLSGGYIINPVSAPGVLFVNPTGAASTAANGTTSGLQPGQTFFAIPLSTLPVSVNSKFANHLFVSVMWK